MSFCENNIPDKPKLIRQNGQYMSTILKKNNITPLLSPRDNTKKTQTELEHDQNFDIIIYKNDDEDILGIKLLYENVKKRLKDKQQMEIDKLNSEFTIRTIKLQKQQDEELNKLFSLRNQFEAVINYTKDNRN